MATHITFDDGAGYEQYMGKWSQLVAERFLSWLAPAAHLHWLDVGCGNGAFTDAVVTGCAPSHVDGVDPSEQQIAFARSRLSSSIASFRQGDAMALPFPNGTFDVTVMPLVIFFLPEPSKGVSEMARVLRPGGVAAAYGWDMESGGFPYQVLQDEMRAMGVDVPVVPSRDASRLDVLQSLWAGAGLQDVQTSVFTVERTFSDFDDYWSTIGRGPSVSRQLKTMSPEMTSVLQARMRTHLPAGNGGRITYSARANAVKGRSPDD